MIYLDSSVALARLFSEIRRPSAGFWSQAFMSSRLLELEVWNRIHAQGWDGHADSGVSELLSTVTFVEMDRQAVSRAFQRFPVAVRTLDAIHLATMTFMQQEGWAVELASYDHRLCDAATALGIPLTSMR